VAYSAAVRIYVTTEESIIKTVIDLRNLTKPEEHRIRDTEYLFFEGCVAAQRELGTINSASADAFIKAYIGKPDLSRKMFLNYRNSLVEKEWLIAGHKTYSLLPGFDLHGKKFKQSGVLTTVEVERLPTNGMDREDTA